METVRRRIIEALREGDHTARDLSQRVRISEKEAYAHLSHIARTLEAQGEALVVTPPECAACGFVFGDDKRFTRPGRCPRCKAERVRAPVFRVG